jgi:non-heme chloroperoxidase
VPAGITTATRKIYHKSPAVYRLPGIPDRGHSLTIDHGWREVAQQALDWLDQRSLWPCRPVRGGDDPP